jgi:hypothetical protein
MKTQTRIELSSRANTHRGFFTKRINLSLVAVAMLAGVAALVTFAADSEKDVAPIFVKEIPPDTATGRWSRWPTKQATSTIFAPF